MPGGCTGLGRFLCWPVQGMFWDADKLLADARSDAVRAAYDGNTQAAIAHGVIGSPTMRIGEDNFFGQDRLDFVEAELLRTNLA